MRDQVRKGRSLKSFPPQEKKMIFPDVMLHTKNVMIPITRPVPLKHSFNVSYSENKPQIVRMQYYKNNPALIFSETPSHMLYNRLENLYEVKRINHWKSKTQNKKYTISGKTNSSYGSKQSSVLQNFCPSRRFSCNRKDNTLHFPNTMLVNYESNNKNLRKASSKSIKLSRKCDVLQIKENEKLYENKLVTMPKKTLNNNINKPIVSLPSQSSHDISDSDFTLSTLSMSNFQIENKKTFANIGKRRNSMSRMMSNQFHPSNSEYEINVLHYENNISADNLCNTNKSVPDFKYSWKLDRWMPYSRKKEHDNTYEIKDVELYKRKPYYDCKIKYSWQVIGTSAQTSSSLLQNLLNNLNTEDKAYKTCGIKYSWQIIGISTQASLHNHHKGSDYWEGMVLTPNKNYNENKIAQNDNNETNYNRVQDYVKYPEKQLKKYLILNSQQTQTFAEKTIQTDINDINDHCMDQILEALANKTLSDTLETERIDNRDELLENYVVRPLTPNISDKNFTLYNNGNEKTKRKELLARLSYTVNKLNQYEQNIDKNRYTDEVSCLDAEDNFTSKTNVLPENVKENINSIIQSAQDYVTKLNYQLKDLDNADQEIENNMMRTLKDVDETFQSLLDDVCYEINKRREQLILEAEIYKSENLIPLRACRRELEAQIQNARSIISTSKNLLRNPDQYNSNKFGKIIALSNDIGRIPAVPYSEELSNINFDRPSNSHKEEIVEQISRLGYISRTVPVQIMNIEERPGGLFVRWHVTNPEYTAEEQTFIVEMAHGEILDSTSNEFKTVYKGSETFCFLRNICVNQPVTLRVRIQMDNVATSGHHVARTCIPPYSWELDNTDYVITNDGKIAVKLTNAVSTLFSHGAQFDANHIIEFKFLEVSQEGSDDEGIALVYNPQGNQDALKRSASLMITSQGKIFMDGEEKLMQLSKMRFGTDIVISAFRKNAHMLRVNIESENKCVTYDWRVQTPLYFAARFKECNKWNLLVK